MDFDPSMTPTARSLIEALRGNAESNQAILTDSATPASPGSTEEVTDDEVIQAIRSVPCHY